jgi:hypothetical protein
METGQPVGKNSKPKKASAKAALKMSEETGLAV